MSSQQNVTKTTYTKTKTVPKPNPPRKAKTKTRRRKNRNSNKRANLPDCYIRTLENPFDNPPCKIGFGTMVPTNLATLYYRGNVSANADGSLGLFLNPAVGRGAANNYSPLHYAASGASVATWGHVDWFNHNAVAPLMMECRVVSCALKALPIVAATATPPIVYAGAISSYSTSQIVASTISALTGIPRLEKFVTREGVIIRSRPCDYGAYEIDTQPFTNDDGVYYSSSCPTIMITGLPAAATVSVDAILHIEYVPRSTVSNSVNFAGNANSSTPEETLTGWFPSLQSMWSYVEPKLQDPAVINTLTELGQRGASYYFGNGNTPR